MKHIQLNNKWRIAIDNNRNHMPEQWVKREGGRKLPGGRVSEEFEGWEHVGRYFPSMPRAVRWIAEEDNDAGTIADWVDQMETNVAKLIEGLK